MLKRGPKADTKKREEAARLFLKGLTYAEIGEALGISRQRAQQLVRPPAPIYNEIRRLSSSRCSKCRVPVSSGHVHHRATEGGTFADNFNDIKNLVYLCPSCHRFEHTEPAKPKAKNPIAWAKNDSERELIRSVMSYLGGRPKKSAVSAKAKA